MRRMMSVGVLAVAGLLGVNAAGEAQVFVRAPFVRVGVGPGVWVRAPFVNIYVPPRPYVMFPPPGSAYVIPPGPGYLAPQPQPLPQDSPAQPAPQSPAPQSPAPQNPPATQPAPRTAPEQTEPPPPRPTAENPLTLQDFAKSFQAQEGSYNVTLINPVSKTPTTVRFTLPAGTPRRVIMRQDEIEFFYGIRHFVRIQFDQDGAIVTSRSR